MCFVLISEQTAVSYVCNFDRLVVITKKECVSVRYELELYM